MYLELSGRQTGKTTRLINHAIDYLNGNPNNTICIVSNYRGNSTRIKNRILQSAPHIIESNIVVNNTMLPPRGHRLYDMYYVDEFSFIDDEHLTWYTNAYYCSTPRGSEFTREIINIFVDLNLPIHVEYNNHQYPEDDYLRGLNLISTVNTKIGLINKTKMKHKFYG